LTALISALIKCNLEQAKNVVKLRVSACLNKVLVSDNENLVMKGLECIEIVLEREQQIQQEEEREANPFKDSLGEEGGVVSIENLQRHESNEIYEIIIGISLLMSKLNCELFFARKAMFQNINFTIESQIFYRSFI